MAKTLDQVVNKWAGNAASAQTAYVDGIRGTTVDPTARAIANEAGYLQGVQQSVGLWRTNLARAGRAKWEAKSIEKAGNFATGVNAAKDDYQAAMSTWLPIIQSTGAAAKNMPGQTIDQRLARSTYVGRTLYNRKRGI